MRNSAFAKKFYLDRHHKMERFGVLFILFFVLLAAIFVVGIRQKQKDDKFNINDQAMYTTKASWSLTDQDVAVKNIYRNSDTTKVFVVLSMNNMTAFSTNSNDYRVFILSDKKTGKITHDISGTYYIFGDTGYMGILLNDARVFEKGLAHLIVRNESRISSQSGVYLEYDDARDSFQNFNQIEIVANLGGQDAIKAESLEPTEIDIANLYSECVISDEREEHKTKLASTLSDINAKTSVMFENKRRLESYGFIVPFPSCLNGDYITTDASETIENPVGFNTNMLAGNTNDVIKTAYNDYDNEGSSGAQWYTIGDDLYMSTNFVFPGGCQFNYQNVQATERYLDVLLPESMSYSEWRSQKNEEAQSYKDYAWFDSNAKWVLDGTEYDSSTFGSGSLSATYDKAINDYKQSVNSVVALKREYQTKQLYEFLDFENAIEYIPRITSVNNSKDVIYVSK